MSEGFEVIALMLGTLYVGVQIITGIAEINEARSYCRMLDMQIKTIEKELHPLRNIPLTDTDGL